MLRVKRVFAEGLFVQAQARVEEGGFGLLG